MRLIWHESVFYVYARIYRYTESTIVSEGFKDITFRNIILEIYAFERNIVIPVKFHISICILKKKMVV